MNSKDLLVKRNSASNGYFFIVMKQSYSVLWICRETADGVASCAIFLYDYFRYLKWKFEGEAWWNKKLINNVIYLQYDINDNVKHWIQ